MRVRMCVDTCVGMRVDISVGMCAALAVEVPLTSRIVPISRFQS